MKNCYNFPGLPVNNADIQRVYTPFYLLYQERDVSFIKYNPLFELRRINFQRPRARVFRFHIFRHPIIWQ